MDRRAYADVIRNRIGRVSRPHVDEQQRRRKITDDIFADKRQPECALSTVRILSFGLLSRLLAANSAIEPRTVGVDIYTHTHMP